MEYYEIDIMKVSVKDNIHENVKLACSVGITDMIMTPMMNLAHTVEQKQAIILSMCAIIRSLLKNDAAARDLLDPNAAAKMVEKLSGKKEEESAK